MQIYKPVALKLYQMALYKIFDYDWCGMNLYYYLKPYVRQEKLLNCKTKERGVLYHLSKYIYREYFFSENSESYDKCYRNKKRIETGDIDSIKGLELIWHIDFVLGFIKLHSSRQTDNLLKLQLQLQAFSVLYDKDEYVALMSATRGKRKFTVLYNKIIDEYANGVIKKNESAYSKFIIDRLFIDRELCKYISELVFDIGLYGDDDAENKNWIKRKKISDCVKRSLFQRESHKCAICGKKLRKVDMTIDHIIPLNQGGHNDIVNLQGVCKSCNHKKNDDLSEVETTIPNIIL